MPPLPFDEKEKLLREPHVAILSVARKQGPPMALPIWYEYRDGLFYIDTDTETLHAKLMSARGQATLTIQDERPPYRYVSVEGDVEFIGNNLDHARSLVGRYIGEAAVDGFIEGPRREYQPHAQTAVLTPRRTRAAWFPLNE